jgi:hypothetical protein
MAERSSGAQSERRRRVALRALIDEMLDEIRAAANEEDWTPEARARAEADLARIMEKVRREALSPDAAESSADEESGGKRS